MKRKNQVLTILEIVGLMAAIITVTSFLQSKGFIPVNMIGNLGLAISSGVKAGALAITGG